MSKQVKTNKQILDELNKQLEAKKEHINKVKKRMELDDLHTFLEWSKKNTINQTDNAGHSKTVSVYDWFKSNHPDVSI